MMKESNDVRGYGFEDCQGGNGSPVIAVVDDPINGDELCIGSVDDVRAFLGAYGDGCVFCRVRLFTVH